MNNLNIIRNDIKNIDEKIIKLINIRQKFAYNNILYESMAIHDNYNKIKLFLNYELDDEEKKKSLYEINILKYNKYYNNNIKIIYPYVIKNLCIKENDDNDDYNTILILDLKIVELLNKRIHIAESVIKYKYESKKKIYDDIINKINNSKNIYKKNKYISVLKNNIKNINVEKLVNIRIINLCKKYNLKKKNEILNLYNKIIIPMNIKFQIDYLLNYKIDID